MDIQLRDPKRLKPHPHNSRLHPAEQLAALEASFREFCFNGLVVVDTFPTEPLARERESAECHRHAATIHNIHDPAKGAADLISKKRFAA